MPSHDNEAGIREEIFRRVITREQNRRIELEKAANDQATLETLQSLTTIPQEELDEIVKEVRGQHEKENLKKEGSNRVVFFGSFFVLVCLALLAGWFAYRSLSGPAPDSLPPSIGKEPINSDAPHFVNSVNSPGTAPPIAENDTSQGGAEYARAIPLAISIGANHFRPITFKLPASWNRPVALSETRPDAIIREPEYSGGIRRYGTLYLGTMEDTAFRFALDIADTPHPLLYFDQNQNGDLSDDGGPIRNQGTGVFAATISIPMRRIAGIFDSDSIYSLWFFTNDRLWQRNEIAFYSRTQLQGSLRINRNQYTAFLADRGSNDADYTNDGIHIDLNRDGRIDHKTEYFSSSATFWSDNKTYRFIVTW